MMSTKALVKAALGRLGNSALLQPLVKTRLRHTFNVVYYHLVGKSGPHYDAFGGGCSLARFDQDLTRLGRVFTFAPLAQVMSVSAPKLVNGKPLLAITFDDGFDLEKNQVNQVLARHGVRATTFVITSCIENVSLMWRHKLSAIVSLVPPSLAVQAFQKLSFETGLPDATAVHDIMRTSNTWDHSRKDELADRLWQLCGLPSVQDYLDEHRPYFGWDGLKRWLADGHDVGFHTHTHPHCNRLVQSEMTAELLSPAQELKNKLSIQQLYFSYPFGDRLQPVLESELFDTGIFAGFFGIKGFKKFGTLPQDLERIGIEQDGVGWPVFCRSLLARY